MSMKVLWHPFYGPSAKLIPDQEVELLDCSMKEKLEKTGIAVDSVFKAQHHTGSYVFPADDKAIFAKAFEQFYFIHGLQQGGYEWKGPEALKILETRKLSTEELAKHIVKIHQQNLQGRKVKASQSENVN